MMKWTMVMNQWLKRGLPGYCAFCLCSRATESGWCEECYAQLPWNRVSCEQCAEPLLGAGESRCGHCLVEPPSFTITTAALCYQEAVSQLVHDFKFQASPRAGQLLVNLMLSQPPPALGNALLPVPMFPARAKERGFNQAHWLAKRLGKSTGMPVLRARCIKQVPSQRSLNRKERRRNVSDAFRMEGDIPEHVTIVDDVVTTGATGHALAAAALAQGAKRVDVWAAARTPFQKS